MKRFLYNTCVLVCCGAICASVASLAIGLTWAVGRIAIGFITGVL